MNDGSETQPINVLPDSGDDAKITTSAPIELSQETSGKSVPIEPIIVEPMIVKPSIVKPIIAGPSQSESRKVESTFARQALDPRSVLMERLVGWCFTGPLVLGGFLGLSLFAALSFPPGLIFYGLFCGYLTLAGFLVWITHMFPLWKHRHCSWRLDGTGFEIRRGIWWRSVIHVPRARVQHTDVQQGPLMRRYGISRLIVHTAGTQNASVTLDGLAFETAGALRDTLIAEQSNAFNVNPERSMLTPSCAERGGAHDK